MFKFKRKASNPEIIGRDNPNTVLEVQKKYTFKDFIEEVKQLEMDNYLNWSQPVKIASFALIAVGTALVCSVIFVRPVINAITDAQSQREALLQTYKDRRVELLGVRAAQQQLWKLENNFNEQLTQLPKESELPRLLDNISALVRSSGLGLADIHLDPESNQKMFIEQPILIAAKGGFHSFGRFIADLTSLDRIITISSYDVALEHRQDGSLNQIPVVKYNIKASTYRYIGVQENNHKAPDEVKTDTPAGGNTVGGTK